MRSLNSVFEQFNNIFDTIDSASPYRLYRDNSDKLVIEFSLPGWKKSDLKVEETNEYIFVSGEKSEQQNIKTIIRDSVLFSTKTKFSEKFVKSQYSIDNVEFTNGILAIVLKQREDKEDRKSYDIK